jgi:integrase
MSRPLAETLTRLEVDRKAETLRRGWFEVPRWVFCTEVGTPLDESKVRKVMARILKKAKMPLHFTPHCLRHTYASLMLQQGEPVTYVQRQLGHASIQLTVDTYGKWLPMGNKAAVERLDAIATEPSGSKMVATTGIRVEDASNSLNVWSRRLESNQRPAVYETALQILTS